MLKDKKFMFVHYACSIHILTNNKSAKMAALQRSKLAPEG